MIELSKKFPEYGFEKHVGYGTKLHSEMLTKFGPCPEHRLSFGPLKKQEAPSRRNIEDYDRKRATTKEIGDYAESIVADYLIEHNHQIIARNHKTKFYEIDIVSIKDDKIFFTEVKYRKNEYRGTSLDMITKKKLKQMTFAAEAFMKYYSELKDYSPLLATGLVSGPNFELTDWFVIE